MARSVSGGDDPTGAICALAAVGLIAMAGCAQGPSTVGAMASGADLHALEAPGGEVPDAPSVVPAELRARMEEELAAQPPQQVPELAALLGRIAETEDVEARGDLVLLYLEGAFGLDPPSRTRALRRLEQVLG